MKHEVESGVTHLLGTRWVLDRTTLHAQGIAGLSPAHLPTFDPAVLEVIELEEMLDAEPGCEVKRGEPLEVCGRTPVAWRLRCPHCGKATLWCEPCRIEFLSIFRWSVTHSPCGLDMLVREMRWEPV